MTKGDMSRRNFIGSATLGAVAGSIVPATAGATAMSHDPVPLRRPMNLWELPTPALVVDEAALQFNLDKMAALHRGKACRLRPHSKSHKCPLIAKKQLERGAMGICAAKVSEAEVMLDAGIDDILITSPVVTRDKINRVVALAKRSAGIAVVVDQARNVDDLQAAAAAAGIKLSVFVDLNVGSDRTGIAIGEPAMALVRAIHGSSALKFAGLQAYAGHVMHLSGWEYRRQASEVTMGRAAEFKAQIERAGIEVPSLTGGGTGTYDIDSDIAGITDMQSGSYIFMDVNYRNVGGRRGEVFDDFRPSLLVLATAISQPTRGRITIDAGVKAFATDQEPPVLRDIEGVTYRFGGDEFGILQLVNPSREIKLGDKVLLIASHCDPTVNLYDQYYPYRSETVTEIWPIAARGRSQ